MHYEHVVKTFWMWRSEKTELILSSEKHASIFFCGFWWAVLNKKKYIYRQNILFKSLHRWLLMHCFSFWSISDQIRKRCWKKPRLCGTFCNSCIWVPRLSSVWKDGSQDQTLLERLQICKRYWKIKLFYGTWRVFLKNSGLILLWTTCKHILCEHSDQY